MTKTHTVIARQARFSIKPGEIILDAAMAQGVDFPHDCRAGRCGTCTTRLLSGITVGGETKQPKTIRACQARALSDLEIEFETLPPVKSISALVTRTIDLGPDVVAVEMKPATPVGQLPGQYCWFTFRGFPARAFSPTEPLDRRPRPGHIMLNVKRVKDGQVSLKFGREIGKGHQVTIEGPYGNAHHRPAHDKRLVLVGSGTGFAPIWAVATAAIREDPWRPLVVIAAARTFRSFYMLPALQRLAALPGKSVIATVGEGSEETPAFFRRGRPEQHLPRLSASDVVYAAGAPVMVDAIGLAAAVAGAGYHADPFEPSSRDGSTRELNFRELGRGWLQPILERLPTLTGS